MEELDGSEDCLMATATVIHHGLWKGVVLWRLRSSVYSFRFHIIMEDLDVNGNGKSDAGGRDGAQLEEEEEKEEEEEEEEEEQNWK